MGRQSVSPYVGVSSNGKTSSSNLENVGSIPTTLANFIGVKMLKNSDIRWERFQKYHDLIESHLPPNCTFGYVGSIWGKWASDDRYFYIEDADGRKVTSGWDCNHMQECWEKLCVHIVTKVICYGRDGWGVHP